MYPQSWRQLAQPFFQWRGQAPAEAGETTAETKNDQPSQGSKLTQQEQVPVAAKVERDRLAMPPPPPPIIRSEPPKTEKEEDDDDDDDEATTPKATPTAVAAAVPTFLLSEPDLATNDDGDDADPDTDNMPPPMFPSPFSAQRAGASADPYPSRGSMAPPPRPAASSTPSSLSAPSAAAAARRQPALPVPNRGPPRSSLVAPSQRPPVVGGSLGSLAPPAKSGRNKVMLTPGHSPLDWARLTADPRGNNLRGSGVPADAPYLLRITPSQLKQMNGRKGRDAWTALGGMVYNITPYVPFHPGGAGELLRCAGKDGNKLFNDVHSWVNYENMLSACRVGILVDEGASTSSPMEEMD